MWQDEAHETGPEQEEALAKAAREACQDPGPLPAVEGLAPMQAKAEVSGWTAGRYVRGVCTKMTWQVHLSAGDHVHVQYKDACPVWCPRGTCEGPETQC